MTTVQVLLSLHILSALVAVGATVSYFFWLPPSGTGARVEVVYAGDHQAAGAADGDARIRDRTADGARADRSRGLGMVYAVAGAFTPALIVLMGLLGFHARVIKGQIALLRTARQTPPTTIKLTHATDTPGAEGSRGDRDGLPDGVQAGPVGVGLAQRAGGF